MTEYASRSMVSGDRPLRRDMRLLGWRYHRLLEEHGGHDLRQTLDRLRGLAEQRLLGDAGAHDRIAELLAGESLERLTDLAHAMGLFFDLANLAEDRHRVRVLNGRQAAGVERETLSAAATALAQADPAQRDTLLQGLSIEPVFTGHPTEAKRRSARRALRRLRRDLVALDPPDPRPRARRLRLERMDRDLSALWYTDPISPRKPSVMEELSRTLFAVRSVWRVAPALLADARAAFGMDDADAVHAFRPLQLGLWVGGDRDGNPYVTADVTRRTLARLHRTAIRMHRRECRKVRRRLTLSAAQAGLPDHLKSRITEACANHPALAERVQRLHPQEWLVQWLEVIDHRLRRSLAPPGMPTPADGYATADALLDDLRILRDALHDAGHDELVGGALQRWRDRIGVFGLHLLRLDIRINSADLAEAVDGVMDRFGWSPRFAEMDEPARRAALQRELPPDWRQLVKPRELPTGLRDMARLFRLLAAVSRVGRGEAVGNLIVSMTHEASDLQAALWLARVFGRGEPARMPVAPLFETIDDLQRSEALLRDALADPGYRGHIDRTGGKLECMVGYSDSAKDGGYLASNWGLYGCQERLAELAKQHDLKLTVFHGRGGAIGRGGGPAARAIQSLPPSALDGRLRLTEQGEVIAERYDDPAIARRHLEQLFWGALTVSNRGDHGSGEVQPDARRVMTDMAGAAESAYRDLVQSPGFLPFLQHCSPLTHVAGMNLGSRPSRRRGAASLDDLRAIPFTFALNQARAPINAFYGLGAAYQSLSDEDRKLARQLYERWRWFRAVIDNASSGLARCDVSIARRYADLSPEPESMHALCDDLEREFQRATQAVLDLQGQEQLLGAVPWLRRTVRVRTPYIDMLNLIQLELLRRRPNLAQPADVEQLDQAMRGSIQALAAGLRNTG
ncbi:MAG: phosphoenolpyruvate carboxylase [Planctomycetota bacterium]